MKKISLLIVAMLLLTSSVSTQDTPESRTNLGNTSTLELRQFRDAWLFGDDESVSVRLESLENDNRLQGVLPRWIGLMRAGHSLRMGKPEIAEQSIAKVLKNAKDARPYIQAIRIYLLHDDTPRALNVAALGAAKAPDVTAMQILKADLTFLNGGHQEAIDLYTDILSKSKDPAAPYTSTRAYVWGDEHRFPANGGTATQPDTQLFSSLYWYSTRFPGLERCLIDMAKNKDLTATMRAKIPSHAELFSEAEDKLYAYRGADAEVRTELENEVYVQKWRLILAVRVAVLAALESEQNHKALEHLKKAEDVGIEDIAFQDLTARVYSTLGMAEEARSGPLARLRQRAELRLRDVRELFSSNGRRKADRIFSAALTLYRANPESGKQQFENLRMAFGYNAENPVSHSAIGLWLAGQNEIELARHYLHEASKLTGFLGGKSLGSATLAAEFALWSLGYKAEEEAEMPEDAEENRPEDFSTILTKTSQAGAILASTTNTESLLEFLADVSLWGRNGGIQGLLAPLPYIPEGRNAIKRLLFDYPAELAQELNKEQLETILSEKHASTIALKQGIDALGKSIEKVKSNDDWRSRQALGEAAEPFFGKVETRVLLLRALLVHKAIPDMATLKVWLSEWQAQIDLRDQWSLSANERTMNSRKAREDASVPEIFHSGLLLDVAEKFANAGDFASAAKLIWFNRDCFLGVDSIQRLMSIAAMYAEKADLKTIAVRCKLTAFNGERPRYAEQDNTKLIIELADTTALLKKHGQQSDVISYIETHLIPRADTADMQAINTIVPEFVKAPVSAVASQPVKQGLKTVWLAALQRESNWIFLNNWAKLLATPSTTKTCDRIIDYILASDFSVYARQRFTGIVSTTGFMHTLAMKAQLQGKDSSARKLLTKLGGTEQTNATFIHDYLRD